MYHVVFEQSNTSIHMKTYLITPDKYDSIAAFLFDYPYLANRNPRLIQFI